jgi:hypothetical protein
MNYLLKLPKIRYKFEHDFDFTRIISNITIRLAFKEIVKREKVLYYQYVIKSESIEVLAHKLYNDPKLFWVIAFANDIFDPYYDWPFLDMPSFYAYLQKKYGITDLSVLQRKNWTLNELEADPTRVHSFYLNDPLTQKQFQISFSEYKVYALDGFADDIFYKTIFDYEEEVNYAKKYIKIPKLEYLTGIKREIEDLLK